jgi:hypothetical protein
MEEGAEGIVEELKKEPKGHKSKQQNHPPQQT